jgi:hypothetical protein
MSSAYLPHDLLEKIGDYADIDTRRALRLPPRKLPAEVLMDLSSKLSTCYYAPPCYGGFEKGYWVCATAINKKGPSAYGPWYFMIQRVDNTLPYREVHIRDLRSNIGSPKQNTKIILPD